MLYYEADSAALSASHISSYPPVTASYLEARISTALVGKGLLRCTSASGSGLMGRD